MLGLSVSRQDTHVACAGSATGYQSPSSSQTKTSLNAVNSSKEIDVGMVILSVMDKFYYG